MSWTELHRTLTDLVGGIEPPLDSGLRVDRAELSVPLEARLAEQRGTIVLLGRVPHSRWQSGFLPAVHVGYLVIESVEGGVRYEP
jgi:hypothetical protein